MAHLDGFGVIDDDFPIRVDHKRNALMVKRNDTFTWRADTTTEPKHFNVIIGLDQKAREKIGEIPYKTVFLHWDLGPCPFGEDDPNGMERLEGIYREIASRMKDLMEILVGPDAG